MLFLRRGHQREVLSRGNHMKHRLYWHSHTLKWNCSLPFNPLTSLETSLSPAWRDTFSWLPQGQMLLPCLVMMSFTLQLPQAGFCLLCYRSSQLASLLYHLPRICACLRATHRILPQCAPSQRKGTHNLAWDHPAVPFQGDVDETWEDATILSLGPLLPLKSFSPAELYLANSGPPCLPEGYQYKLKSFILALSTNLRVAAEMVWHIIPYIIPYHLCFPTWALLYKTFTACIQQEPGSDAMRQF